METLALIDLLDGDGQARQSLRVTQWPVRIGRALDCDFVLDDPHVAPHHVDLVWRDDRLYVDAQPSVNGVRLGRSKLMSGSAVLPPDSLLDIGAARVRVRLANDRLAPEQPLADVHEDGRRRAVALVVLGIAAALCVGFDQWVSSTPGEPGTEVMGLYLMAPMALGLWCAFWALGSKLFQRYFAFWPHLQVALFWPLVALLAETVSGQVAFALSMPAVAKAGHVLAIGALAMLLWRHLSIVMPQRRRSFAWGIVAMVIVGSGLDMVERSHRQRPLVGSLYLGTISLPGLRLASPVSADAFVKSAQPLEDTLSRWAKAKGDDSDAPESDEDGG